MQCLCLTAFWSWSVAIATPKPYINQRPVPRSRDPTRPIRCQERCFTQITGTQELPVLSPVDQCPILLVVIGNVRSVGMIKWYLMSFHVCQGADHWPMLTQPCRCPIRPLSQCHCHCQRSAHKPANERPASMSRDHLRPANKWTQNPWNQSHFELYKDLYDAKFSIYFSEYTLLWDRLMTLVFKH